MTVPFFVQLTRQKTAQPSTNVAVRLLADNVALGSTFKVFKKFNFSLAVGKTVPYQIMMEGMVLNHKKIFA